MLQKPDLSTGPYESLGSNAGFTLICRESIVAEAESLLALQAGNFQSCGNRKKLRQSSLRQSSLLRKKRKEKRMFPFSAGILSQANYLRIVNTDKGNRAVLLQFQVGL